MSRLRRHHRPLRIAIDLTALTSTITGIDRYLIGLVRHLGKVDPDNLYTVFVNAGDRRTLANGLGSNVRLQPCCVRARAVRLLFQQCALPVVAAAARYDVVHSPSFFMPLWKGRARHLLSVHDMTFFSMPALHSRLRRSGSFRRGVAVSIRRADLLSVPSEATRRDLLRLMPDVAPERVRVTPYGVEPRFSPAAPAEVERHVARLGIPRPYILHVGTIEPRKNLGTLLESYGRLVRDGQTCAHLVLTGAQGWGADDVRQAARSHGLRGRVHLAGHVADDELPWVYRGAAMFVYPSLYEGFGFPPLEAMACGIPVIASLGSSLEENLRGAVDLVAPHDTDALTTAMRRLERDGEWHQRLARLGLERAAAFRWERTAHAVLQCYVELGRGECPPRGVTARRAGDTPMDGRRVPPARQLGI